MDTPLTVLLKDKGFTIQSITPGMTVYDCALKLAQFKVGALLVIDSNNKLVGIISERDILRKIVASGQDPKSIIVDTIRQW